MGDLPEMIEQLSSRVDALEKRVHDLEHPSEAAAQTSPQLMGAPALAPVSRQTAIDQASSLFPVVGLAMLGVAGAYLLRAVAESNLVAKPLIAAIAIVYAIAWLFWAARAKTAGNFPRAIYAGSSALILGPMLWELTLRFQVLSPALAAGLVCGFVLVATVLAWHRDLASVFWVAQGAAAIIALTLSIATHALMPFLAALLLMMLICEYAVAHHRGHGIRTLVAAVADVAVWTLIFIYSGPQSVRTDYPALGVTALVAPACLLFLINGVSLVMKTMLRGQSVTIIEAFQAVVAFLLTASSVLFFAPPAGVVALGFVCLILSGACYAAAFLRFRSAAERRNFNVFAVWSAGLFLVGTLWTLPTNWMAACLGVAALVVIVLGVRLECMTLDFHGVVYLTAAVVVSGLLEYTLNVLTGSLPDKPVWSIVLVSICAVLSYAAGKEREGESWQHQILHFVPALLAACAVAALMAQGLLGLVAHFMIPEAVHVAFARTFTVCTVALVLAFGGSRWHRLEMTRIAYAALFFEAIKLLFEDLRSGQMGFAAASIFLFAVTLIGVPRLVHLGHKH